MRVRMLANVVGHEGVLAEGAVVDCQDPRVDDWIERGFAVALGPEVLHPDREPAPTLAESPPAPMPEQPAPKRERRRG